MIGQDCMLLELTTQMLFGTSQEDIHANKKNKNLTATLYPWLHQLQTNFIFVKKKMLSKILNKPKTGQYINMDRITKIDIFKQETHWSTIIE